MAYLFQSGSLEAQLSGGVDFNYSNVETDKLMAINSDAANPSAAAGTLGLGAAGAGSDGSLYWDGSALCVGAAGSKTAHFDGDGLDLVSGDEYLINNTTVLHSTGLGTAVTGSSLTAVGTLVAGQLGSDANPLTAYINAGELDGTVIGGESAAAATVTTLKATTISGSSTLIVDGASTFNSGITVKASQNITLGYTSDTALDVSADALYFLDATNGYLRVVGVGSFCTDIAGAGLSVSGNKLTLEGQTVTTHGVGVNQQLSGGMNVATAQFGANRTWTLPRANTGDDGDIYRVKVTSMDGNTLTISPNSNDAIDDLAASVSVELESDNASISLMCIDNGSSGKWKIF